MSEPTDRAIELAHSITHALSLAAIFILVVLLDRAVRRINKLTGNNW